MHPYNQPYILSLNQGNNALCWQERLRLSGRSPQLTIPALKEGNFPDVVEGKEIVFEEVQGNTIISCTGLQSFIRVPASGLLPECVIFDNHNHALFFWIEALRRGIIEKGCELLHIDQHSDLWENPFLLDIDQAQKDLSIAWKYTNLSCNVGNYILPAQRAGLIGTMKRIENEYQIDAILDYSPKKNSILNIDLDIFSPELDYIDQKKKIQCIRVLREKVAYITLATSPYFIEPCRALKYLHQIFL